MTIEKLSAKTVWQDLKDLQKEYGSDVIVMIATYLITELMWWRWPELRGELKKDLSAVKNKVKDEPEAN